MTPGALLIGLAGGFASALLFSAVLGGGALAAPLVLLSPLPLAIAALGWGSLAGLIAAVAASAVVTLLTHPIAGVVFLVVIAGPAAWYAHQIGLARPLGESPDDGLEWFPLDRVFLWITGLTPVTLIIAGSIVDIGVDDTAVAMADAIIAMSEESGTAADLPPRDQLVEVATFYTRLMPVSLSALWLTTVVLVLALAARVVRISGRLRRPPERLSMAFGLPVTMAVVLAAALALAVSGTAIALPAGAVVGALAVAFAIQGFAVIHVKLAGHPARMPILAVLYGATFLFSLPALGALVIGVADSVFDIRKRRSGPPAHT